MPPNIRIRVGAGHDEKVGLGEGDSDVDTDAGADEEKVARGEEEGSRSKWACSWERRARVWSDEGAIENQNGDCTKQRRRRCVVEVFGVMK